MNVSLVNEVKSELARLQKSIKQLENVSKSGCDKLNEYYVGGPEAAAVKRASMDVTRVLARLRRGS